MSGRTSAASKNKYNLKAYDRITILVKKGEKEEIKVHAEKLGKSTNAFINEIIKKEMRT